MKQRDLERLQGVHARLVEAWIRIDDAMDALGFPVFVVEGVRSADEQVELYEQGRIKPGKIVTNCDGVRKKSNHQPHADGLGYALDFAFVDDPRTPKDETWDPKMPWDLVGLMAEKFGLTWGGRWTSLVDLPHIELKED